MKSWRKRFEEFSWDKQKRRCAYSKSCAINPTSSIVSKHSTKVSVSTVPPSFNIGATPATCRTNVNSFVIMSIVEGRGCAAGEIGIASLDIYCPAIELSQFQDSSSYSRILVKLLVLKPNEIIVPHTALDITSCMKKLIKVVREFCPHVPIIGVKRNRFNDRLGLSELRRLCHPEYIPALSSIGERFYTLSAAAALLHYTEEVHGLLLAPRTLKFSFTGCLNTTMIDVQSACRLELVENAQDQTPRGSFFAAVDHTCNPGGARLLRANLLQPPCDLPTIVNRQNAIAELIAQPDSLLLIQNILRRFPYVDGLLSLCVQISSSACASARSQTSCTDPSRSSKLEEVGIHGFKSSEYSSQHSKLNMKSINNTLESDKDTSFNKITINVSAAESRITRVIAIKSLLDLVTPLRNALEEFNSVLFETYKKLLSDPGYSALQKKLCTVLHEDLRFSKGILAMQSQKCFAIKEGLNVVLDVTRKAYSEQLDDVTAEIARLSDKYKLPMRVGHNKHRGFYIQIPEEALNKKNASGFKKDLVHSSQFTESESSSVDCDDCVSESSETDTTILTGSQSRSAKLNKGSQLHKKLPPELIKSFVSKGIIHCTSNSLIRLNVRMRGSLHEVYYIADQIICDLISELNVDMSLFYRLSEVIASLDFLCSLAVLAVKSTPETPFAYPHFGDKLAIKNGRNLSLECQSRLPVVPNHIYAAKHGNLTVLTGPSMSGKTTYLKQIAYIQILAQIGSLVPAEFSMLRIADQLHFHSCGQDDLASNESSFTKDMRELSFIMRHMTSTSLILIDGMCESTNPDEAADLSWAICEHFIRRQAFVFIATNRTDFTHLAFVHPSVETYHFVVEENDASAEDINLDHSQRIRKASVDYHISDKNSCFPLGSSQQRNKSANQNCSTLTFSPNDKSRRTLIFTYKLAKGVGKRKPYGMKVARFTSMPENIILRAEELVEQLSDPDSAVIKSWLMTESNATSSAIPEGVPHQNTDHFQFERIEAQQSQRAERSKLLTTSSCLQSCQVIQRMNRYRLLFRFFRQLHLLSKHVEKHNAKSSSTLDNKGFQKDLVNLIKFLKYHCYSTLHENFTPKSVEP